MSLRFSSFALDKGKAKISGVCAGLANSTGIDPLILRIGLVLVTLAGAFPWTVIAHGLTAWLAPTKARDDSIVAHSPRF